MLFLALRSLTENLPKPVILTSSPPLSVSVTTRSKASLASTSAFWAIFSISSILFMVFPIWRRLWFSGSLLGVLGGRDLAGRAARSPCSSRRQMPSGST